MQLAIPVPAIPVYCRFSFRLASFVLLPRPPRFSEMSQVRFDEPCVGWDATVDEQSVMDCPTRRDVEAFAVLVMAASPAAHSIQPKRDEHYVSFVALEIFGRSNEQVTELHFGG